MTINDAHCHFFSTKFFETLGLAIPGVDAARAADVAIEKLGWESPGSAEALANRWAAELDRHLVGRAALMASVPADAASVGAALQRHPARFVGFFMVDPTRAEAPDAAADAIDRHGMRAICLFPAMHRYPLHDDRVRRLFDVAAARPGVAVFVHCGVLSVGARTKLGIPSPFDIRFGNPLDLHAVALAYPTVSVIVPHFGAGMFRETLMVADLCPNVYVDTSSSNRWMAYQDPTLTLARVFTQALAVLGPNRMLFGTDSSFFPRGWVADVFEHQSQALDEAGIGVDAREKIFSGNFERLFPSQR